MKNFLHKYWPTLIIGFILGLIIALNFHPGKLVLGNDNFSPELNPKLTILRSIFNPAWRDYRVLGIPSDSEQADIWRSILFYLGEFILPTWAVSQGYLFLTLVVGVLSMGKVVQLLNNNSKYAQFFGSLLYLFSPITVWVYFYPVQLFVAAYAFSPLVLWMFLRTILVPSRKNKLFLLLASLFMGTTALTATMFITASITIISISFFASISTKYKLKNWLIACFIYTLPQLFWILPFGTYVKNNSQALQDSFINREITSTTTQSEQSTNTAWNSLRFSSAWMDTKENDINYTYPARSWFKENIIGGYLGYLPAILAAFGFLIALRHPKNNYDLLFISIVGIFGWIFLNGNNPPFNQIYQAFDKNIPLFHQVFRWGSSKFWPILLLPMLILATKIIDTLLQSLKNHNAIRFATTILISSLIIYAVNPIFTTHLVREEVFIQIPASYIALKNNLPNETSLVETTPHTNTRYFRKHDWGFWGSVFINYLIPNPTTEKALIIGSHENESAFNLLEETYYSGNEKSYLNSLLRFNIPYILSDKSVTNNNLGNSYSFPYQWNIQEKMITNNVFLKPIWTDNFLTLYSTNNTSSESTFKLSPNHDLEKINKIFSLSNNTNQYITSKESGSIYPLALIPSEIHTIDNNLVYSSQVLSTADYKLEIPNTALSPLPLITKIENSKIIITPYFPSIILNDQLLYDLPTTVSTLPTDTKAVTLDNQIVSNKYRFATLSQLAKSYIWTKSQSFPLQDSLKNVKPIPCNKTEDSKGDTSYDQSSSTFVLTTDTKSCFSTEINITSSGIPSITASLQTTEPTLIDICLHSYKQNTCLNSPETIFGSNERKNIKISSNHAVEKDDNIVVFFIAKPNIGKTSKIHINNLEANLSTNPIPLKLQNPNSEDITLMVEMRENDVLKTSIPITNMVPSPQVFTAECPNRGPSNSIVSNNSNIEFSTTNCFDGIYSSFSIPEHLKARAILTYFKSSYVQGVPLEYNLKQNNVDRKITTDLLSTHSDSDLSKLTVIPETNQNFTQELINRGIGTNPSHNLIHQFVSIPIPTSWLNLNLELTNPSAIEVINLAPFSSTHNTGTYLSKMVDKTAIYSLPTATSPYWMTAVLHQKPSNTFSLYWQVILNRTNFDQVSINGWQPGWEIQNSGDNRYLGVIYFPNVLAYLGIFIGISAGIILILKRSILKKQNDPSVHV